MPDTFVRKREEEIVDFVERSGKVPIQTICAEFQMSPSNARIVLNKMNARGLIVREHGFVRPLPSAASADQGPERISFEAQIANIDEKRAIAREAVKYVQERDTISIAGGTTTFLFAKELKKINHITVVTNSVLVAAELLSNESIEIRMCNGIIQHDKGSLGSMSSEDFFSGIYTNKLFIGADAISASEGVTSGNANVSRLERIMANNSDQVIVLSDHTKFGKRLHVDRVLGANEIDLMIVDSLLPPTYITQLKNRGIRIAIGQM